MKNTNELLDTLNRCLEYMEISENVVDGETPSPNKEMTLAIELREAVEYLSKPQPSKTNEQLLADAREEVAGKKSTDEIATDLQETFLNNLFDLKTYTPAEKLSLQGAFEQGAKVALNTVAQDAALLSLQRKDEEHDREMEGFAEWIKGLTPAQRSGVHPEYKNLLTKFREGKG